MNFKILQRGLPKRKRREWPWNGSLASDYGQSRVLKKLYFRPSTS